VSQYILNKIFQDRGEKHRYSISYAEYFHRRDWEILSKDKWHV